MAVEMAALSKFKLQLLALVSEARHLRESERSAREELDLAKQRQKQLEAEYGKKLQELSSELASRDESQRQLEAKMRCLENDNAQMEKKERELRQTVNGLLQSRDSFMSTFEDSTYTLRCGIEARDYKLAALSDKIHAHVLMFDSIEMETVAVKQVLDRVQDLINEKEHVVTGLQLKMDKISFFEKEFIEKICFLESKLHTYQHEIRRRNAIIFELKEHLEALKSSNNVQPQVRELQNLLAAKEEVIQTLTSEKQVLQVDLQNSELSLQKIQNVLGNIITQNAFSPGAGVEEACEMINTEDSKNSLENISEAHREGLSEKIPLEHATENAGQ